MGTDCEESTSIKVCFTNEACWEHEAGPKAYITIIWCMGIILRSRNRLNHGTFNRSFTKVKPPA